ncbi:FAD-dependent oxidoreductase [Patescibacteria group bacterium]|jgi:alkyl hydroperoxide reductase subunit F|nr:FAD-dependent oxidoreductase [Patescibacteria group bacterium]
MSDTLYDLIIIGGGPAGVSAAVYAARKKLTSLLITPDFGGQSVVSVDIQNWIGTPHLPGPEMAKQFEAHVMEYADPALSVKKGLRAERVARNEDDTFTVETSQGTYSSRTVLIATGADRRKLTVPGAQEYEHKGVTYCASCDGPMFTDQDVAVIGGGNAGFESAAQLLAYCKSVTLLEYNDAFKAEQVTVDAVLADPKMTALTSAKITQVHGEAMVTGLSYEDLTTGEVHELAVTGIFVEIGILPATQLVSELVELDELNRIPVDARNQRTSIAGLWAAGDCTNELYHQNNIAAGDGVKALEDIYVHLKTRGVA